MGRGTLKLFTVKEKSLGHNAIIVDFKLGYGNDSLEDISVLMFFNMNEEMNNFMNKLLECQVLHDFNINEKMMGLLLDLFSQLNSVKLEDIKLGLSLNE